MKVSAEGNPTDNSRFKVNMNVFSENSPQLPSELKVGGAEIPQGPVQPLVVCAVAAFESSFRRDQAVQGGNHTLHVQENERPSRVPDRCPSGARSDLAADRM